MAFYSTLDASLFRQGSDPERSCFAKDIVTALKKTGFVKLRNHGISPDILKDIFNWVCPSLQMSDLHLYS